MLFYGSWFNHCVLNSVNFFDVDESPVAWAIVGEFSIRWYVIDESVVSWLAIVESTSTWEHDPRQVIVFLILHKCSWPTPISSEQLSSKLVHEVNWPWITYKRGGVFG